MIKDVFVKTSYANKKMVIAAMILTLLLSVRPGLSSTPRNILSQNAGIIITGFITDPSGTVLTGAKISARNSLTGETQQASSDSEGKYTLLILAAGKYVLTVTASRFQAASKDISVGADQTATLDFHPSLSPVSESIEVSTKEQTYLEVSGTTATKLDTPVFDLSQSVQIVRS